MDEGARRGLVSCAGSARGAAPLVALGLDRKSTRLNSSHRCNSYAPVYPLVPCTTLFRSLESAEDFAESARAGGLGYGELLERLMDLGLKYRAQWRATYG